MTFKKLLILGLICGAFGATINAVWRNDSKAEQLKSEKLALVRTYAKAVGMTVHKLEFMPSMLECKTYLDNKLSGLRASNPNVQITDLKEYVKTPGVYAFAAAELDIEVNAMYCFPSNADGAGEVAYLDGTIKN